MGDSSSKIIQRNCCVCGYNDYKVLYKPPNSPGPLVICTNCGFIYINPIETTKALILDGPVLGNRPDYLLTSSNVNDIQGSWEQPIIDEYLKEIKWKILNAREVLKYINALNMDRGNLLDIGCFCGVFLSVAKENGWNCYGIEPLVMPAIYARSQYHVDVTTDTIKQNSYPKEFFNTITAFQVFEHLVYPEKELELIHNLLKPGGLLLIEIPNIDTFTVKLLKGKHRHFVQDHVSFFSPNTLSRLLQNLGFSIEKIYWPSRIMSLRHFFSWVKKYNQQFGEPFHRAISSNILDKSIRIRIGDIVTVLARRSKDRHSCVV